MNTNTETAIVEVLLANGTIATKRATALRNYTHALVTDDEVISWHTDRITAQRAWYRKAGRVEGTLRIVRARMS